MIATAWWRLADCAEWALAALWMWRTNEAIRRIGEVTDISTPAWDLLPPDNAGPSLTVVVPARNEAENIRATLDFLLASQYSSLYILAIDDRSTDATRQIVDEFARRFPDRVGAIHIDYLPEGWLGKTFALEVGARNSSSDYILFTDADVLFSPSSLRRAMAFAVTTRADHVVVMPTPQVKGHGEGMMLGFLSLLGVWLVRPWRVSDPAARRDVLGVGAFNLVRREALNVLGGWEPQRLALVEDVTLGRRMKPAGMRQRVAFGAELVVIHWAKGARGIVRGLTKNLFASVNFNSLAMLSTCLIMLILFLGPIAGLALGSTFVPALLALCSIAASYRLLNERSGVRARYGWLYPVAVIVMVWAVLRSMLSVWIRRGVMWRGTFYPLRELRLHNSPWQWELTAAEARRTEEMGTARFRAKLLALWPALRRKRKKTR
ncbi:MAG TPA: glycosyltransferase family 2 protein [Candidatus Aquilonibacter sp.]|nr:glycosyltransferase family 2 protein [Candidatus Aquilonibacter sp.]